MSLGPLDINSFSLEDFVRLDAQDVEQECLMAFSVIYPDKVSYDQALCKSKPVNSEGTRQYQQWKSHRQTLLRNLILPPFYLSKLCLLKILQDQSWGIIAVFLTIRYPAIMISSTDCAMLFDLEMSKDGNTHYTGWRKIWSIQRMADAMVQEFKTAFHSGDETREE